MSRRQPTQRPQGRRQPDQRQPARRQPAQRQPDQRERVKHQPPARTLPAAERVAAVLTDWTPAAAGILLGLVLAWFGYHELVRPALWTGYVPVIDASSGLAVLLVLAHGWLFLLLAVALIAGIAPRAAATVAAVALAEIVISLAVTGGLSDLVLRDVGVLGLAICLTGCKRSRIVLAR
jgi:hypothetical protein